MDIKSDLQSISLYKLEGRQFYNDTAAIMAIDEAADPLNYKLYGSPLLCLFYDRLIVISHLLTQYQALINDVDIYGRSAIFLAIDNLSESMDLLFNYGANINLEADDGHTPLSIAVLNAILTNKEAYLNVVFNCATRANVNYQNKFGNTALHVLQYTPIFNLDMAKRILEILLIFGADINIRNNHGFDIKDIIEFRPELKPLLTFIY